MTELPLNPSIGETYYWGSKPLVYDVSCGETLMRVSYYAPGMQVRCDADKCIVEYAGTGWSDAFTRFRCERVFGSAWRVADPSIDYLCVVQQSAVDRSTITFLQKTRSKFPAVVSDSPENHRLRWVDEKYSKHWVASYRDRDSFFLIDPVTYEITEFEKTKT